MRILNISSLYPPHVIGGAELGLRTMSEAMVELGHEVHVATLQPPQWARKENHSGTGSVDVHQVPLANTYWPFTSPSRPVSKMAKLVWHSIDTANFVMAKRIENLVEQLRPDVVLTRNLQGFSTAVMPAIKRTGVPLVHVLHDVSLLCPKTTMYRQGSNCGTQSERCKACRLFTAPRWRHLRHVDAVIGVSQAVLDVHRNHGLFADRPAQVIHNALGPALTIPASIAPREAGHLFTFGYMGRIERSKGIETLLTAVSHIHASGMPFRLLVAGRGDARYLESLQRRWPLAEVDYVGFVEPDKFFKRLDTLVFPSVAPEALGNGVFEALSQGVPVIGSDSGGIGESITPNVNGFVFRAGDAEELQSQMTTMLMLPDLRVRMGREALLKAPAYLAANRAAQYLSFLGKIVRPNTRRKVA